MCSACCVGPWLCVGVVMCLLASLVTWSCSHTNALVLMVWPSEHLYDESFIIPVCHEEFWPSFLTWSRVLIGGFPWDGILVQLQFMLRCPSLASGDLLPWICLLVEVILILGPISTYETFLWPLGPLAHCSCTWCRCEQLDMKNSSHLHVGGVILSALAAKLNLTCLSYFVRSLSPDGCVWQLCFHGTGFLVVDQCAVSWSALYYFHLPWETAVLNHCYPVFITTYLAVQCRRLWGAWATPCAEDYLA